MQLYIAFLRVGFFCGTILIAVTSDPVPAEESAGRTQASDSFIQQRLDHLQREVEQLKKDHADEIRVLKEQQAPQRELDKRASSPHKSSPVGTYGGIMNPDISAIANVQTRFTDDKDNDNRNRVLVREVELAFQGYLYPGIRAEVIPALETEYEGDDVAVDIDLEEAYVTASQIPYLSGYVPLELQAGRKFIGFGRLNPVHPHHWPFADVPLVFYRFFGRHNWLDDGVQGSITVQNPWDLYLKPTFGIWNGKTLGHVHAHEHEKEGAEHERPETADFDGHVFLSRNVLGVPFNRDADGLLGYSLTWDEGTNTVLHGGDLTFTYRWASTYNRIRWQNEIYAADVREGVNYTRYGGYSLLVYTLDKYWETGARYDRSQLLDPDEDDQEWAATGFLSYYLTHSVSLRGQYRFCARVGHDEEHSGYLQLLFGLGPHAHRLVD